MKKCPTCEKTFDDAMRFCQTDGTPLVEETPEDPYKTMVAGKDEIAAAIPPASDDPFKTMVAGASQPTEESEDLLQIPEEDSFDSMKTMIAPQNNAGREAEVIKKEEIKVKPIKETPSPFDNAATPSQPRTEDKSDVFSSTPPAPQSGFSSGGFEDSSESDANDQTVMYPSSPLPPLPKESSEPPPTILGDSPFNKPNAAPIPSPFDDAPKPSYEMPANPPMPTYKEPEPPFGSQSNPFNQPSFNQGENINQNMQQQNWNPPPAPDSSWQNQNIGQNTPFHPPSVGGGHNQTLAIISLVLGILSIPCCGFLLFGIASMITGFIAKSKADQNPGEYGGRNLALAGIIIGAITILLGIIVNILYFLGLIAAGGY